MNKTRKYVPKRSEDAILLAKFVRENDEIAFARIVRKYEALVWNICCRVLHSRQDAEDAFQQTFLLLASKARRIRKPNSLSSWLYGVAFRSASSIRRQRQRDMLPYETTADPNLTEDVLEFVARKNENELVSAEIMLMKEKHKTPLLMFYFMGDSTAQIAETLGITISAVEGRLRQARRALRSQLRLRGVDFETTCAALVVPVLALSPSLTVATINKIAAASASSLTGSLYGYLNFMNHTGAKLMLSKLAVSFSIVCVASLGVMHHGGAMQEEGEQVTKLQSSEPEPASTIPMKFVQDDEEEHESHLHRLHVHLHEMFKSIHNHWHPRQDAEREHAHRIEFETDLQFSPDAEGEAVWVGEGEEHHGPVVVELANPDQKAAGTYRLRFIEPNSDENEFGTVEMHIGHEVPLLGRIPFVGHLFKNVQQEEFRFKARTEVREGVELQWLHLDDLSEEVVDPAQLQLHWEHENHFEHDDESDDDN